MKICLKKQVKQMQPYCGEMDLIQRLPERVQGPCHVHFSLQLKSYDDYFIATIHVSGLVHVTCLRCLHDFPVDYRHETELAICHDETTAERLVSQFDCVVLPTYQLDLAETITDDLHLFLPEKHNDSAECNPEISRFISS